VRILRAAEEGYIVSYIVCPGGIVGPSNAPLPTASIFFKFIMQVTLAFKKPIYVGEGSSVFYMVCACVPYNTYAHPCLCSLYQVRLDDLVALYGLLFIRALSGVDAKASPYSRYYIAASTPLAWKHITTVVGATLKKLGKLEDGEPQSVSALQPPCVLLASNLSRT